MKRGIHTRPNQGSTDEWITPQGVVRSLGIFDLDPCAASQMPWPTATTAYSLPLDGLSLPWLGRVWLNPPYGGELKKWLGRLVDHGNGIALVPARTEVESWFWPLIWERADAILFLRGRLYFHRPDGSRLGNAGHGSVLVAYGLLNVEALKNCGIQGRLIEQIQSRSEVTL